MRETEKRVREEGVGWPVFTLDAKALSCNLRS